MEAYSMGCIKLASSTKHNVSEINLYHAQIITVLVFIILWHSVVWMLCNLFTIHHVTTVRWFLIVEWLRIKQL
jgi:hypothetical protein